MGYMFMPLRRYFDFSGRSRRMEYWMFFLFVFIVTVILIFATGTTETTGMGFSVQSQSPIVFLWIAALVIPSLAVQVRRFHDQDRSGWMVLLGLIPLVGFVIVLVFMFLEGTRGPNRFGPDPKGNVAPETFA